MNPFFIVMLISYSVGFLLGHAVTDEQFIFSFLTTPFAMVVGWAVGKFIVRHMARHYDQN